MIRALQEEVCAVVASPSRMSGQGHFTEDQNRGQLWGMAGRRKAEVNRSPPGLDRSSGSSARLGLPCSKSGQTVVRLKMSRADHSQLGQSVGGHA